MACTVSLEGTFFGPAALAKPWIRPSLDAFLGAGPFCGS